MPELIFRAMGHGDAVRDLLEGLVWVTGQADYRLLAAFVVITGFLIVMAACAVRGEGIKAIPYIAAAVLFWFCAMVPTARVVVQDNRSATVHVVDNVPLGAAFVAATASGIGFWLTEAYESAFVPVDAAKFSRFGAVFPQRIVEVVKSTGPVTLEARQTLAALMTSCVMPELLTDKAKAQALCVSDNAWATVASSGWVNPARAAAMPDGTVLTCPKAVDRVTEVFSKVELPALKRVIGAKLASDSADPSAVIVQALPQAESLLLGVSRSMDESLRHAVTATALSESVRSTAAAADAPLALAVDLAKSQGNLASEINYRTMAKIAQDFLPKVRNALEIVVIGLFPVVVLLALVAGNAMGMILKSYVMVLAGLELWPAAASIVNFLMIERDAGVFASLLSAYGGDTVQAAALIRETGASAQAVGGALMLAVPVICYMIVCGGTMAIGQMTGTLTAPAQSAAQGQGASLAAGNISQGNVSLGNESRNTVRTNKSDQSVSAAHPGTLQTQTAWGSVTRAEGGEVTGMKRTGVDLGVSAMTSQGYARSQVSAHGVTTSGLKAKAATASSTESVQKTVSVSDGATVTSGQSVTRSQSLGETYSDTQSASRQISAGESAGMSRTDRVDEGRSYESGIGSNVVKSRAGLLGEGRSIGAKAGVLAAGVVAPLVQQAAGRAAGNVVQGTDAGEITETAYPTLRAGVKFTEGQSLNDQAELGHASSGQRQATAGVQRSASVGTSQGLSDVNSVSRMNSVASGQGSSRARSSQRTELRSYSDLESSSANLSQSKDAGSRAVVDDSYEVMRGAIADYGSPEAALRAMSSAPERQKTAARHFEAVVDGAKPTDAFGHGVMPSATARNADVADDQLKMVPGFGESAHQRVSGDMTRIAGEARAIDQRAGSGAVGGAELRSQVAQGQERQAERVGAMSSDAAFNRGVMMAARELYHDDVNDKNYFLRNAFLAGLGYRDGASIQNTLRENAAANPKLRAALTDIGYRVGASPKEIDWNRMMHSTDGAQGEEKVKR